MGYLTFTRALLSSISEYGHYLLLSLIFSWEHWLGKKAAGSTIGLLFWAAKQPFKRGKFMEDDIKLGTVGALSLSFSGGKAVVSAQAAIDGSAVMVAASVTADAGAFIDQLEAIVAKALPSTAAIDPAIFAVIKDAVLAIK